MWSILMASTRGSVKMSGCLWLVWEGRCRDSLNFPPNQEAQDMSRQFEHGLDNGRVVRLFDHPKSSVAPNSFPTAEPPKSTLCVKIKGPQSLGVPLGFPLQSVSTGFPLGFHWVSTGFPLGFHCKVKRASPSSPKCSSWD